MAVNLNDGLLGISQDLNGYLATLNERWRELEELTFATELLSSCEKNTLDSGTYCKETKTE